jgi:hypothetical protein
LLQETDSGWKACLKSAQIRFGQFAEHTAQQFLPPVGIVGVLRQEGGDPDYERTLDYLKRRFDPWRGEAYEDLETDSDLRELMFESPAFSTSGEQDSVRWRSNFYVSPARLRETSDRSVLRSANRARWETLKLIAADACRGLEESGQLDEFLTREERYDTGSAETWMRVLFFAEGGLHNPSIRISPVSVVQPTGYRTCRAELEDWLAYGEVLRVHGPTFRKEMEESGEPVPTWLTSPPEWPDKLPTSWFQIVTDVPLRSIEFIDRALARSSTPNRSGSPGFLGLIVSRDAKSVSRRGFPPLNLSQSPVLWSLFSLLYEAGGKPRHPDAYLVVTTEGVDALRKAKCRLKDSLLPLGIRIVGRGSKEWVLADART